MEKEEIAASLDAIQDPVSLQEPVYNDGTENIFVMDAISNNTTEIKNEVSEMRKEINSHDGRIVKVEESVKSAHHRLDGLEERLNEHKEV